jgi:hypothetical protein
MEILVFLAGAFAVTVYLIWRSRRRSGLRSPIPPAEGDRPEPAISNESAMAPHRNLGRPWYVDRGDRPPGAR